MLKTVWGLDGEHPRPIPTQNVGLRSSMALDAMGDEDTGRC